MLGLLLMLYVLGTLLFMLAVMVVLGGLRASDLRERLLNAASHAVMYEGEPIPGVKPPLLARATFLLLSPRRPAADQRPRPTGSKTHPRASATR
jgi:hypothetical protein